MVKELFPSVFEFAAVSAAYGDGIVVNRSSVNDRCVIISAREPVEFLLNVAAEKELPHSWIDRVTIHYNTDGSLSVWDN